MIDSTAERMLAVGVLPLGQVDYVAKNSEVESLHATLLQKSDLVVVLSVRIACVVTRIRARINVLEKLDVVSADLLIAATADLEKTLWMLQAKTM